MKSIIGLKETYAATVWIDLLSLTGWQTSNPSSTYHQSVAPWQLSSEKAYAIASGSDANEVALADSVTGAAVAMSIAARMPIMLKPLIRCMLDTCKINGEGTGIDRGRLGCWQAWL